MSGWAGAKRLNGPDSNALPDLPVAARVVAALREEARADDFEDGGIIERFLSDTVTLEQTYKEMLKTLADTGTKVFRYGRYDLATLVDDFDTAGLQILGPTDAHLEICRRAIASSMSDAITDAVRMLTGDATASVVEIYRNGQERGHRGTACERTATLSNRKGIAEQLYSKKPSACWASSQSGVVGARGFAPSRGASRALAERPRADRLETKWKVGRGERI